MEASQRRLENVLSRLNEFGPSRRKLLRRRDPVFESGDSSAVEAVWEWLSSMDFMQTAREIPFMEVDCDTLFDAISRLFRQFVEEFPRMAASPNENDFVDFQIEFQSLLWDYVDLTGHFPDYHEGGCGLVVGGTLDLLSKALLESE